MEHLRYLIIEFIIYFQGIEYRYRENKCNKYYKRCTQEFKRGSQRLERTKASVSGKSKDITNI